MCCPLVFEFSVGIGGFVIGLGQISFFFSVTRFEIFPMYTISRTTLVYVFKMVQILQKLLIGITMYSVL